MLDKPQERISIPQDEYLKEHGNKYHDPGVHYYDPEFLADMQDLFCVRRAGHAFHHVMSGEAYTLWEEFTRAADTKYYPFNEEAQLIQSNPDWFRMAAGLDFGEGSIVVEMGTGSDYSAEKKTIPFLQAVNASVYVGVDKSFPSASTVAMKVREVNPDMPVFMRITDFNTNNMHIRWSELNPLITNPEFVERLNLRPLPEVQPRRRILAQFGSTLGNMEGSIDSDPPMDKVVSSLRNYRTNMRKGDILFIGLDQNQDKDSLDACYSSPLIGRFSMEMLKRMKEDLPVSEAFNPDDFEYVRMWNKRNGLYFHGFNAKNDTSFKLGGKQITARANNKFSYVNSWKLKQEFLERCFHESRLRPVSRLDGPGNRIHIHALEAV